MSAFGKRNGIGNRGGFGVAKPMNGAGTGAPAPQRPSNQSSGVQGGEQFPPLESFDSPVKVQQDAMSRLAERSDGTFDTRSKVEGFQASVQ